jgi:hypothetical protein
MDNASKDNLWRLAPDASIFIKSRFVVGKLGARSAPNDVAFAYITEERQ